MTISKAKWKAQIYHDKCVKAQIEEDLQVLVACLIDIESLEFEILPDKKKYDVYPSCKSWQKEYCYCKSKEMVGKYKSYRWYGNSRTEIYCEIIKSYCGRTPLIIPFTHLASNKKEADADTEKA